MGKQCDQEAALVNGSLERVLFRLKCSSFRVLPTIQTTGGLLEEFTGPSKAVVLTSKGTQEQDQQRKGYISQSGGIQVQASKVLFRAGHALSQTCFFLQQ
jgi:hypothetical protein